MLSFYRGVFAVLFCGLSLTVVAQSNFNLSVGMNLGASRLFHQTRFETTTLRNLYETIEITHPEGYEWEQFEEDFQLRQSFDQLRYGFFVKATHPKYPIQAIFEAMSSTSTYERMAYSVTLGFGEEFYLINEEVYASFLGGFKIIWDKGFGANTLVNSIGHKEARQLVATYFAPEKPLGPTRGNLFVLRGSVGKTIDKDKKWTVGADVYGELDLTPRIKRESRMSNIGLNLFVRYSLRKAGRKGPSFNNNPNYYY